MGQIDTTSFAQSMLGGMHLGSGMANAAADNQYRQGQAAFQKQQAALHQALTERQFASDEQYRAAQMANMDTDNARAKDQFDFQMSQAKDQAQQVLARKAADGRVMQAMSQPSSPSMLVPDAASQINPEDIQNASPHLQDAWVRRSQNTQQDAQEKEKAIASVEAAKKGGILRQALEVPGGLIKDVERFGLWGAIGPKDMPVSEKQRQEDKDEQVRSAMIYDMAIQKDEQGRPITDMATIEQMSQMPLPMVAQYYKQHMEQQAQVAKIQQQKQADDMVVQALMRKGLKEQDARDKVTLDRKFPQNVGGSGPTQSTKLNVARVKLTGAEKDADRAKSEYEDTAKVARGGQQRDTSPPTKDEFDRANNGKADAQRIVQAWQRYQAAQGKARDARNEIEKIGSVPESGSAHAGSIEDAEPAPDNETKVDNILDILQSQDQSEGQ